MSAKRTLPFQALATGEARTDGPLNHGALLELEHGHVNVLDGEFMAEIAATLREIGSEDVDALGPSGLDR